MTQHQYENMALTGELFNLVSVRLFYHLLPEYGPLLQTCWTAICRKTNTCQIWTANKETANRLGHDVKRIRKIADLMVGIRMNIAIVFLDMANANGGMVTVYPGQMELKKEPECPYLTAIYQSASPQS